MPSFPTLTEDGNTIRPNYPYSEKNEDSVIRSEFDGGYVQTRARYSRVRKTWQVVYTALNTANKLLVSAFVNTVQCGADNFTWVDPVTSTSYDVRFLAPPVFNYVSYNRWDVKFTLEQV